MAFLFQRLLFQGPKPLTGPLYNTHVPTATWEKALLAIGAGCAALLNPERGDMVAALGETTGHAALLHMRHKMLSDETGRSVLRERPLVTKERMTELLSQHPNVGNLDLNSTFGSHYTEFMSKHAFDANERSPVCFVDNEELAYVMLRYRQVHDFMHVLTGLPPTVRGELALKVLELKMTRLPMAALGVILGPLRIPLDKSSNDGPREIADWAIHDISWALKTASNAPFMLNIYFEKHMNEPIGKLRKHLRIIPYTPQDSINSSE
jgi:ubiquinone biosynthesis protein COQ4